MYIDKTRKADMLTELNLQAIQERPLELAVALTVATILIIVLITNALIIERNAR